MSCITKLIILILPGVMSLPYTVHSQDNIFNGTTNTDWNTETNWSTGKVPPAYIVQKITIAADCTIPASNNTDYIFEEGSTLHINPGINLINNGTGNWTMNGSIAGEGSYTAELIYTGIIEPGEIVSTWTCGDPLVYGGQSYATVEIGGKCWMAENLNVGTMIVGASNQTNNSTIEKYCYEDEPSNCATYGGFYQWDEMMQYSTGAGTQGVCPTGWYLPSDDEWKTLEMELGMTQAEADMTGYRGTDQGSQLAGNEPLWANGALDEDDAFGDSYFIALPGGYRYTDENFYTLSQVAGFWSSLESGNSAWTRGLAFNKLKVFRNVTSKDYGFSVRCVQN